MTLREAIVCRCYDVASVVAAAGEALRLLGEDETNK